MCSKEQKITKVSPRTSATNIRGKSLHPGLCVGSSSSVFAETYASSSRSSKSFLLPVYYNTKPSVRIHKNHEFVSNAYHIKMTNYLPGSRFGNPRTGTVISIITEPTMRKLIHHAPTQRGSIGVKFRLSN